MSEKHVPVDDSAWLEAYTERLAAHGRAVRDDCRLSDPTVSVHRRSPICGSTLTLDLRRDGETILEIGYAVRACALGQVGMSVIASVMPGRSIAEARNVRDAVWRMLTDGKDGDELPGAEWADLELLKPARELRSRHGSVMLPFDAVIEAIDQSDGEDASADRVTTGAHSTS